LGVLHVVLLYQSFLLLDGQNVSICTLAADPADFIRGRCSRERFAIFAKTGASVCCWRM